MKDPVLRLIAYLGRVALQHPVATVTVGVTALVIRKKRRRRARSASTTDVATTAEANDAEHSEEAAIEARIRSAAQERIRRTM